MNGAGSLAAKVLELPERYFDWAVGQSFIVWMFLFVYTIAPLGLLLIFGPVYFLVWVIGGFA